MYLLSQLRDIYTLRKYITYNIDNICTLYHKKRLVTSRHYYKRKINHIQIIIYREFNIKELIAFYKYNKPDGLSKSGFELFSN